MEDTARYIIEKIAPIFNSKGYVGTSLSDLTKATKLTKGALYCNFSNKEELAVEAFRYNLKQAIYPLYFKIEEQKDSISKLFAITSYYREYYEIAKDRGGCPILNVGTDAKHNNQFLHKEARAETKKIIKGLAQLIQDGIEKKEIIATIDSKKLANNLYSMIEGGIFLSLTQENQEYLNNILDYIDESIIKTIEN